MQRDEQGSKSKGWITSNIEKETLSYSMIIQRTVFFLFLDNCKHPRVGKGPR